MVQASRAGEADCYLGARELVSGAIEASFGSLAGRQFSRVYKCVACLSALMANFPWKSLQIGRNLGQVKAKNP